MSGPEDEYQDPHGQCTDEIRRLTAGPDGARADRAQTTSDALVVVIRIRDELDEARVELESAESQIAVLRDERDALAVEVGRLRNMLAAILPSASTLGHTPRGRDSEITLECNEPHGWRRTFDAGLLYDARAPLKKGGK